MAIFFPPYLQLLILNSTDRGSQVLPDAFLSGGGPRISQQSSLGEKTLSIERARATLNFHTTEAEI